MSKVSRRCPICDDNFIVVLKDKGKNKAWPSCWNCSFTGHNIHEKKALIIDLELNPHLQEDEELFKEAVSTWNEYLDLLDEEKELETTGET